MKITFTSFKTANGNKVFSNNASVINNYIISEEGLNMALDIAKHQSQKDVWDMLSHKMMYISHPFDKENDKDYHTLKVFVVKRTNGEIEVWSNNYLTIENKDVIFTELDEAKALTEKHQDYEDLVAFRDFLASKIGDITEEINDLAEELGK